MRYIQLTSYDTYLREVTGAGPIEWDAFHYCTPEALTPVEKATFKVVPLVEVEAPTYNQLTQKCEEGIPDNDSGPWKQTWVITALTPEELENTRKAKVPKSVTMRQARLALHFAGLLGNVIAIIDAMEEPEKTAAKITWDFAQTVDRDFGMVPELAVALGLTEREIDNLFVTAGSIQ
jgi:hypothetical protein